MYKHYSNNQKQLANQVHPTDMISLLELNCVGKQGKEWVCFSPFKDEKTPSFKISVGNVATTFNDLSAGISGNNILLVRELKNFGFVEAMRFLTGQEPEEEVSSDYRPLENNKPAKNANNNHYSARTRVHAKATPQELVIENKLSEFDPNRIKGALGWLEAQFTKNAVEAMPYMGKRGFTSYIPSVGFVPNQGVLIQEQLASDALDILKALGVVGNKNGRWFDYFRNRVVYTHRNIKGELTGFSARKVEDSNKFPKYMVSINCGYYYNNVAINSDEDFLIVVEGQMDALALEALGLPAVALCGKETKSDSEIYSLNKKLVFMLDGDEAGNTATIKAMKYATMNKVENTALFLEEDCDPAQLFAERQTGWLDFIPCSEPC